MCFLRMKNRRTMYHDDSASSFNSRNYFSPGLLNLQDFSGYFNDSQWIAQCVEITNNYFVENYNTGSKQLISNLVYNIVLLNL